MGGCHIGASRFHGVCGLLLLLLDCLRQFVATPVVADVRPVVADVRVEHGVLHDLSEAGTTRYRRCEEQVH